MLDWHISINRGKSFFEGKDLDQIIEDMIKYYVDNDLQAEEITLVSAYDEDGQLAVEYSGVDLGNIQERVEEGITDWRETINNEAEGFRAIQGDYLYNLI